MDPVIAVMSTAAVVVLIITGVAVTIANLALRNGDRD